VANQTFTSTNGLFKLVIDDTGITMVGPQSGVVLLSNAIVILAGPNLENTLLVSESETDLAGPLVSISAQSRVELKGTLVDFNAGARPIARQGDLVSTANGFGVIVTGNPSVDA
jgi:hypothetical protein